MFGCTLSTIYVLYVLKRRQTVMVAWCGGNNSVDNGNGSGGGNDADNRVSESIIVYTTHII